MDGQRRPKSNKSEIFQPNKEALAKSWDIWDIILQYFQNTFATASLLCGLYYQNRQK
jgi:hypothetical protein